MSKETLKEMRMALMTLGAWRVIVINHYHTDITHLTGVKESVIDIMFTHGSPLGNRHYGDKNRERSIAGFTEDFNREIVLEGSALKIEMDRIFEILCRIGALYLVCCCKPKACHGDVIKRSLDDAMVRRQQQELFKR
jgi:hypothetical protein